MDYKELYFTLIAAIALLAGFSYSYFIPTPAGLEGVPFTAVAMGLFLAGTLFFGYAAFIPALLFGLQVGAQRNAAIFLYVIPAIIAIYAGTKLGVALHGDYAKRQIFLEHGKKILLLAIFAILLAIVIEMSLPLVVQYWPQDFLGMNIEQGNSVFGLIGQLTSMIQH